MANLKLALMLCSLMLVLCSCSHTPEIQTKELEQTLQTTPQAIRDTALLNYVQSILCKLAPVDCKHLRLYITEHPHFHATMHPEGFLHLSSGAFLRIRDEAELAALLAHEVAHYQLKHVPKIWGGRAREIAADEHSITLLHQSGYSLASAMAFWQRLSEEHALIKKQGRLTAISEKIKRLGPTTIQAIHTDSYSNTLNPYYLKTMKGLIARGDSPSVLFLLKQHRNSARPQEDVDFLFGEIYRHRDKPEDKKSD